MEKITKLNGRGIVIRGDDIDTDRIIPARFLKEITFENMGKYAFFDERFDANANKKEHPFNDEKYKGAEILVVNKNFGCGSSREHAPQSLMRFGIKAIIGESFGEIFAVNSGNLGIPILTGTKKQVDSLMDYIQKNPGEEIQVYIIHKSITYNGITENFEMSPSSQKALLEGTYDSLSMMIENEKKIVAVEKALPYTW